MNLDSIFKEKLEKLIFLEITKEGINKVFDKKVNESIYLPILSKEIVSESIKGDSFKNIPSSYFIEGMFFVLGGDENFKFSPVYKELLKNKIVFSEFIKGKIYKYIENKSYLDAYILLKGLFVIEDTAEIYDKLYLVAAEIEDGKILDFKEEICKLIELGKENNFNNAYLYEGRYNKKIEKYKEARLSYEEYFRREDYRDENIKKEYNVLKNICDYEDGRELIYDNPKESLQKLIPLLKVYDEDASLRYHIAVAYRILENNYKAIYYLNEAYGLDNGLVEIFNEFGLNYAVLGDFTTAITYFRKAFEATKSIDICTNIILCYYNLKDLKNARLHLDLAKKIDSEDDIVKELEKLLEEVK